MIEDRIVTTEELRSQAEEGLDADLLLPAGVFEMLEDPGFHVLVPKGRVVGPEVDKMFAGLLLDSHEGKLEVEVNVEDDYYHSLPTPYDVLVNLRQLLPDLPMSKVARSRPSDSDDEPF